jgi:hypothetical protein
MRQRATMGYVIGDDDDDDDDIGDHVGKMRPRA